MDPSLLLRGPVLGFAIAAPVGPIGVLVIRRSLADGRTAGFFSGLGAATADALYGAITGFGLTSSRPSWWNSRTRCASSGAPSCAT